VLEIHDSIQFLLPRSRELLFPVLAQVQTYVEGFPLKMKHHDTQSQIPKTFHLHFGLDWPAAERDFFAQVGLEFRQEPEELAYPDALIDLREERLQLFQRPGRRHVADVCGILAGSTGTVLPHLRLIKARYRGSWGKLGNFPTPFPTVPLTPTELIALRDGQLGGIVAYQSWESYLAAPMSLPVIEILPRERPRQWLSKWINPYYRLVEEGRAQALLVQLQQAFDNLGEAIQCSQVAAAPSGSHARTAPMRSDVGSVSSLSQ
jgi:hypothetical protein